MKSILQIKLIPTHEQFQALSETMQRVNTACDTIASVAFEHRCASKFTLQRLVYHDIKAQFGLSAQMTILAIRKVVDAYKRDKNIHPTFKVTGAIVYDQRVMAFKGVECVSLWTVAGRLKIPIIFGDYQKTRWHQKKGQADLVLRDGVFYLLVTVEVKEEPPIAPTGFIGVDFGVVNIATDSDGTTYTGQVIESVRQRFQALRKGLQSCGTKSARRHLQKIRHQESRFRKHENHCISKRLVETAKRTLRGIALEDLTGIRDRIRARKSQRSRLHGWAFSQLRQFVEYKAALAGVPVITVDPRYTSQSCSACGHVEKANRPTQAIFHCCSCGFSDNADHNAAKNIATRASVNTLIVGNGDGKTA